MSGFALLPPSPSVHKEREQEAVKKEEQPVSRGDDRLGQHGQSIFILGWRGTNEEWKISNAHVRFVFHG